MLSPPLSLLPVTIVNVVANIVNFVAHSAVAIVTAVVVVTHCHRRRRHVLASQWHGGNTCACHCEARIGSLGIPVVKIVPQQRKLRIDDGKTSLSINLCLNASLRRTLVCHHKSGTCTILPAPLGQLFCGLPLGGEACTGCRTSSLLQQKVDQFMSRHALEPCI